MTRPAVRIVVDHVVLDGLPLNRADLRPMQLEALIGAFCAELRRRVLDDGGPAASAGVAAVHGPDIEVTPETPAAGIGQRAGAATHAALAGRRP
jgi:hypothetical protein